MADEKVNREERHPISCLCAKCVEDDRLAQIEAIRRRDDEQERREIHRQRERERRHSSRLWLKIGIYLINRSGCSWRLVAIIAIRAG